MLQVMPISPYVIEISLEVKAAFEQVNGQAVQRSTARVCGVYRGEDSVRSLELTCATVGYPKTIRVDQGSEFVSRDLDL